MRFFPQLHLTETKFTFKENRQNDQKKVLPTCPKFFHNSENILCKVLRTDSSTHTQRKAEKGFSLILNNCLSKANILISSWSSFSNLRCVHKK